MKSDPDDLCNPGSQQMEMQFDATGEDGKIEYRDALASLGQKMPGLAVCFAALFALPKALEEALGTPLRVPQTMLLAAYPPGSFYRRHYDSYGGEDIPRILTVLLYIKWSPESGGHLRCYSPTPPTGTGDATNASSLSAHTAHRDIEPKPGRLVIFYSQEVAHEVLTSEGERLALTLWIWDRKRDRAGR
jgi:SM-20-related protein